MTGGGTVRVVPLMVPPAFIDERSIGFCGAIMTLTTVMVARAQALWLTAYFGHALEADKQHQSRDHFSAAADFDTPVLDPDAVTDSTVLHSRCRKWRYPVGFGLRFPDFVFDAIPYIDMLLKDLGLAFRRKRSWWDELFQPYGPGDYRGLLDEWRIRTSSGGR